MKEWKKKSGSVGKLALIFLVESLLIFVIISSFGGWVVGQSGENVTVNTFLKVGEVPPEVLNISINNDALAIDLVPNSTKTVVCQALVRDWNNDTTISNVTARLFDGTSSFYGDTDDNNYHYANNSCLLNTSFGTWHGVVDSPYLALANCSFQVQYYSNPGSWNCTAVVTDNIGLKGNGTQNTTIAQLLAVGLPSSIDYGTVNGTFVSDENITNVTNKGNVKLNLSLSGYANTPGDGYAMNCTLGSIKNIDINYEKYNLTVSHTGPLSLTQFEANYTNLTSSAVVKKFNLSVRQNDVLSGVDDTNSTYWRIYVPIGVAGTCEGNVVFGASVAPGN